MLKYEDKHTGMFSATGSTGCLNGQLSLLSFILGKTSFHINWSRLFDIILSDILIFTYYSENVNFNDIIFDYFNNNCKTI